MKRILFALSFFALLFPSFAFAQVPQKDKTIILSKNQSVNHDYLKAANAVIIDGIINGDAYVAGATVLINGVINGDILAAGGNVIITGTARNIRVVGGQVNIEGIVLGNITAVGGNVNIANTAKVSGSLVALGGQISVMGPLGKGATIGGGQITLASTIGKDVMLASQNLTLTSKAKIAGGLTYVSANNAVISQGALVAGSIRHQYPPKATRSENQSKTATPIFAAIGGLAILYGFVVSLILGIILLFALPFYTKRFIEEVTSRPLVDLGIGALVAILTPAVFIVLFVTLLGIPFAVLEIFVVGLFAYIGRVMMSIVIGKWIVEKLSFDKAHIVWFLIVGLIAYEIISFIPVIGGLFKLIVILIGLGGIVIIEKDFYTQLRAKKLI